MTKAVDGDLTNQLKLKGVIGPGDTASETDAGIEIERAGGTTLNVSGDDLRKMDQIFGVDEADDGKVGKPKLEWSRSKGSTRKPLRLCSYTVPRQHEIQIRAILNDGDVDPDGRQVEITQEGDRSDGDDTILVSAYQAVSLARRILWAAGFHAVNFAAVVEGGYIDIEDGQLADQFEWRVIEDEEEADGE